MAITNLAMLGLWLIVWLLPSFGQSFVYPRTTILFKRPKVSSYVGSLRAATRDSWADNNNKCSTPSSLSVRRSDLEKNGGLLYRTSIFEKSEMDTIRQDLANHVKNMVDETSSSVANHRLGAVLPRQDSETVDILRQGSLVQWVRAVSNNPNYVLKDDHVPVEIRSYEKQGAGMEWHSDDVLFDPPQLEVVWTLENSSDCVTMYKRHKHNKEEEKEDIHMIETDPNSVLLIQAGGPSHCVTSLKQGKRIILKCVYALKDATFLPGAHLQQFGGDSKSLNSKKRQKLKRGKR